MPDDYRIAGGLQGKHADSPTLWGPVRDAGAPREPKKLDSSAGLMEAEEPVKYLQLREGVEEVVWQDDDTVYLPDLIRDTAIEQNVVEEYNSAAADDSNPLDEIAYDDIDYVDADLSVPDGSDQVWSFAGYTTGATREETDDSSWELLNYLELDLPDDAAPVDLEHMEDDGATIHFDRPVYEIDLATGDTALYRGGEEVYSGDLDGMLTYLEDEIDGDGWDDLPATPSTAKVQAAIRGGPAGSGESLHPQVSNHLLPDDTGPLTRLQDILRDRVLARLP